MSNIPTQQQKTPQGHWRDNIDVMHSAEAVADRVRALGEQITRDYEGRQLCLIGVLKGSFMFFADLVRSIDLPVKCEFIGISSYGNDTKSSGIVRITHDLQHSIEGLDVILVEDIVDTGLSMSYLLENFRTRRPRSLKVCTLLEKPENLQQKVPIDYVGFRIPNAFVVGYGLDAAGIFRNLPFIGIYNGSKG